MRRAPPRLAVPRRVTVVTGEMFAPRLRRLLAALAVTGLNAEVAAIANDWFGRGIQVAGLLTARDILAQLAGDPGDEVLVPAVAVRDGDGVFLDDLAPADVEAALGVPVRVVAAAPDHLVRALVGGGRHGA